MTTSRETARTTSNPSRVSWASLPSTSSASRRHSTMSFGTSSGSNLSMPARSSSVLENSPRVQLVPHSLAHNYDITLSESENEILNNTNFDELDLSSKDFDFEDIFTYDRTQKKVKAAVEASPPQSDKDWSQFSFSHHSPAAESRKVQRNRSVVAEMYVKNKSVARKK